MDLQPSAALRLPQIPRAPIRCSSCSGFLNPYCKVGQGQAGFGDPSAAAGRAGKEWGQECVEQGAV